MKKVLVCVFVLIAMILASADSASISDHRFAFIGQVGSLPDTVVFSPVQDSEVLISIYLENQTPHPANAVCASVKWTDDIGAQNTNDDDCSGAPFYYRERTRLLHVKGGTTVRVAADSPNTPPDQDFSLFVTVRSIRSE